MIDWVFLVAVVGLLLFKTPYQSNKTVSATIPIFMNFDIPLIFFCMIDTVWCIHNLSFGFTLPEAIAIIL